MKSNAMNKMVLGTAQLGSLYGVANRSGCPSVNQGMAILKGAYEAGIKRFDTASSYGTAERLLGLTFSGKEIGSKSPQSLENCQMTPLHGRKVKFLFG